MSSDAAESSERIPTNHPALEMRKFCRICREHRFFKYLILTDLFSTFYLHGEYHRELGMLFSATRAFSEQTLGLSKVLQKCSLPPCCCRFPAPTFNIKLVQTPHWVTSVRGNRETKIFVNVCFTGVEAALRGKCGGNPDQGTSFLMRLIDKNHRKRGRNCSKASGLVNSGTHEVWLPTKFCLLVDSAVFNKLNLLNYALSAAEALGISPPGFSGGL